MPWRCPFLALSKHQRRAKGGKRGHKAKVENRLNLRAAAPRSGNLRHTGAKVG
jgi:hypothetical protein